MGALFPVTLQGATHRRRGKTLAGPIDLTLDGQGACMVIGPNGAGKSTLLKLIHGTARLSAGHIDWACGTKAARHEQAFVFQSPVMLRRSVLDNIAYPLRLRGVDRTQARHRAGEWASRVGLGPMLERQATVLSGGEQQKLALARALITSPQLLFLDEPCAALDGQATRDIETILSEACAAGTALIMATHDMGQARRMGTRVLFLLGGKILEDSPADEFFTAPKTPQAQALLNGDIVT
ncbi:MAG: ATP-binding cassette domain-containing protein [Brevirhabdus sp.]